MSYVQDVLRRRQEAATAWRERYNPLENLSEQLLDIDAQMKKQAQAEAEQKRQDELFGLKKTESQRLVEKYEAERQRAESDIEEKKKAALALAGERELRGKEWEARAAAQREEARRKEQQAALETGARDVYGRLLAKGQTLRDVLSASGRDEAEKAYAKKMAGALAKDNGTPEQVARLEAELADTQKNLSKKIPGGLTAADIEELADAYNTSYGAMLAEVQRIDRESQESLAGLGLTGEQTERQKTLQEADRALAALRARQGFPKPTNPAEEADKAERRRLDLERVRLTNEKIKLQTGELGGFRLTPQRLDKVQEARIAAVASRDGINSLRNLIKKYPNFESYTGPLDNAIAWAEQKFGAQSEEAAEIRATILGVFQAYKLIQTGQASGNAEMEMLANIMPKTSDMLPAIIGKIDAYDNLVMNQIQNWDLLLGTKDVRGADVRAGIAGADPYAQYSED